MNSKSIEKRASSALQVGVKRGQPSRGYYNAYLLAMTCV